MSKLQRWTAHSEGMSDDPYFNEDDNGEWVSYEDAKYWKQRYHEIKAELEAENAHKDRVIEALLRAVKIAKYWLDELPVEHRIETYDNAAIEEILDKASEVDKSTEPTTTRGVGVATILQRLAQNYQLASLSGRARETKSEVNSMEKVSEVCRRTAVQNCLICERGECCDNLNPRVDEPKKLRYRLCPELVDGSHWTVVDTIDEVLHYVREWCDNAEACQDDGAGFDIQTVFMADWEIDLLPEI